MPNASRPVRRKPAPGGFGDLLPHLLLGIAAIFYLLCFLHLHADFPNMSPWNDWSKMTDEGWYGGGAIHHFVTGHWYLPDSFNPAVAMPVWPFLLGLWFKLTGVGMAAARTLTLLVYGASLVLFYALLRPYRSGLMPAVAVALMAVNPFCYAFDRLAILEPLMVFWLLLGLWIASKTRAQDLWKQAVLGAIVCLLVLTKTTGLFLAPAILYQLTATIGWPVKRPLGNPENLRALRPAAITAATGLVLWLAYYCIAVLPHHHADYRLLFTINPDHVHLSIIPAETLRTLADGLWMSRALWLSGLAVMLLSVAWLRELWRLPLFGASVVATVGYLAFIMYHTNLQPRYYLVVAMPVVAVVLLGIDALWQRKADGAAGFIAVVLALASIAMIVRTVRFVIKPEYTLATAAADMAAIIHADAHAKPLLLSNTGDDLTLLTGLPALCDQYSVHGHDAMLDRYHPGWAALWEGQEDTNLTRLASRYHLTEEARYKVFDDPTRAILILYRLDKP